MQTVLNRLHDAGVTWAPCFIGVSDGDEVLSWLPGMTVDDWQTDPTRLDRLTTIVRQLHDLTAGMVTDAECVVHDDLQPRNVVITDDNVGLIDWEQCRGGSRVEDVAQLCWSFVPPVGREPVGEVASRWRRVLDVYGLHDRSEVPAIAMTKLDRCVDDLTVQAADGSVRHQAMVARGDHLELQAIRDWLAAHGDQLTDAIS